MRFICSARLRPGRASDPSGVYGQPPLAVLESVNGTTDCWWRTDYGPQSLEEFETRARTEPQMVHNSGTTSEHFYYVRGQLWAVKDAQVEEDDFREVSWEERDGRLVTAAIRQEGKFSSGQAGDPLSSQSQSRLGAADINPRLPRQRKAISDDVRIFVWRRDEGRCTRCETNAELEFDHIIPLVMGGSNTARNLQLLCGPCNRAKGGNLV